MAWSANNRACTTTWSTLFALEQSLLTFPKSGEVQMQHMQFWITAATPELRRLRAQALANRMDVIFRVTRGAEYEEGSSLDQAIEAMVEVMSDANATMEKLAEVNDASYRFWQEGE
jgi:hypothetical protein